MASGFIFLAVATGIMTFAGFVSTCIAFSDRKEYAPQLAMMTAFLAFVFLTAGFLGFSS